MSNFEKAKRLPNQIDADWVGVTEVCLGNDITLDLWTRTPTGTRRTFRVHLNDVAIDQIKRSIVRQAVFLRERAARVAAMPSEEQVKSK